MAAKGRQPPRFLLIEVSAMAMWKTPRWLKITLIILWLIFMLVPATAPLWAPDVIPQPF